MIFGIGVDLVEVRRMERILKSSRAGSFLRRVFSSAEVATCEATAHPAQGYSARFAAKEATAKALGTGFTRGITPGGIVVRGGEKERPSIVLQGKARALALDLKVRQIHLSLSHTDGRACAFVVLEKADEDRPDSLPSL
jgi:holo-[acyl-carrier protein] synthase